MDRTERFKRSLRDKDGYVAYNEVPLERQAPHDPPPSAQPRLAAEETFDYSVRFPPQGHEARCTRPVQSWDRVDLLERSPHLRLESVGMLCGGGSLSRLCPHIIRPAVCAIRVRLNAVDDDNARVSAASFGLGEVFVNSLREGDELNVTRTRRGGLGLSVLRDGDLLAALGAVTAVPLGRHLRVAVRRDRLSKDVPPPCGTDADECVTILRTGACPETAAYASTHLLAISDALCLVPPDSPVAQGTRWLRSLFD